MSNTTIQQQLLAFTSTDAMLELLGLDFAYFDIVSDIIHSFETAWNTADCDSQGATKEQDAIFDSILEEYSNDLFELIK